jgi:hypothetical protein
LTPVIEQLPIAALVGVMVVYGTFDGLASIINKMPKA